MKDKRQRIAVAWPYAAVYSDPAFAASILQAAATSVALPYAYPGLGHPGLPNPALLAQSHAHFPSQMLSHTGNLLGHPNHFSPYNHYARYAPYPIPANSMNPSSQGLQNSSNTRPQSPGRSSSGYPANLLHSINLSHQMNPAQSSYLNHIGSGLNLNRSNQKDLDTSRNSSSPVTVSSSRMKNNESPCNSEISVNSNLSMSPGSGDQHSESKPQMDKILSHLGQKTYPQYSDVLRHHQNHDSYAIQGSGRDLSVHGSLLEYDQGASQKIEGQTGLVQEKPKLFKPYKSEA